jgi:hypothetical protein
MDNPVLSDDITILPANSSVEIASPVLTPTPDNRPVFSRLTPLNQMSGPNAVRYIIKELQKRNAWTNVRAAELLGIEERYMRRLKAGEKNPSLDMLLRIVSAGGARLFLELPERPIA